MKSFFSRIAIVTVFSLLTAAGLSIVCFNYATPALAGATQLPELGKEEKNRLKEELRKKKEEEKRQKKELEQKQKEEVQRRKEEAKNSKPAVAVPPLRADGLDIAILMKDSRGIFSPVNPGREFV